MSFIFESDEAYQAREGVRQTLLKEVLRSPAHAKEMMTNPKPPTDAMIDGTWIHQAILQPNLLEKIVIEPKFTGKTKDGKESALSAEAKDAKKAWYASLPSGTRVVDEDTLTMIKRCADAVYKHPMAKAILNNGKSEQTVTWQEHDLTFKARPDFYTDGIVVDLKKTRDASPRGFARQARDLKYALQAYHYTRGVSKALGEKHETFLFICVEATSPYLVSVFELDADSVAAGKAQWMRAVETYKRCRETDTWPGYSDNIQMLTIVDWGD